MITCPEIQDLYGKDVFVAAKAVPGGFLEVGQELSFSLKIEEGSRPVAIEVSLAGPEAGPADGLFYGTVKMFNAAKGLGMIECNETHALYGKDVFVAAKAAPDGFFEVGQQLSFTVKEENQGPVANDVSLVRSMTGPANRSSYGKVWH